MNSNQLYQWKISTFDTHKYRVVQLLKQFPETRNSDNLLIRRYLQHFCSDAPIDQMDCSVETITRCRRWIQSKNPELRADEIVSEFRSANEEVYKDEFKQPNKEAKEG